LILEPFDVVEAVSRVFFRDEAMTQTARLRLRQWRKRSQKGYPSGRVQRPDNLGKSRGVETVDEVWAQMTEVEWKIRRNLRSLCDG
jgi:hypothetical protein